jgi:hypothetical protein
LALFAVNISFKNDEFTVFEKVIRKLMREEKLIVPDVKRKKYDSYKGEITCHHREICPHLQIARKSG